MFRTVSSCCGVLDWHRFLFLSSISYCGSLPFYEAISGLHFFLKRSRFQHFVSHALPADCPAYCDLHTLNKRSRSRTHKLWTHAFCDFAGVYRSGYYAAVSAVNQQQYIVIGWKLEITRFTCDRASRSWHMFSWLSMLFQPYTRIFHITQLKYGNLCNFTTSNLSMKIRPATLSCLQFTFFSRKADKLYVCGWNSRDKRSMTYMPRNTPIVFIFLSFHNYFTLSMFRVISCRGFGKY